MMKAYTTWRDLPTCPYCGEEDHDWWDGLEPKDDGDSWEIKCDCGKRYKVWLSVEALFKADVVDTERQLGKKVWVSNGRNK